MGTCLAGFGPDVPSCSLRSIHTSRDFSGDLLVYPSKLLPILVPSYYFRTDWKTQLKKQERKKSQIDTASIPENIVLAR